MTARQPGLVQASVVICTYNRPGMLTGAVRTARAQCLPAGHTAEVLVVDNSPDGNARAAIEVMAAEPGLKLRYLSVTVPNISFARNAGMAASEADYIVFLDDDEWCEAGWLAALLATAEQTGADLVFGAVLPEFPDGIPDWDLAGRSYERRLSWPTGTPLTLRHDARVSGRWIATCNSLLRRATCCTLLFDPALGRCGGEDYDLFVRLFAAGRRFTWCAEAVVHELVPADRTTLAYMLLRSFRAGQIYGTITVRRSPHPLRTALVLSLRAAVQLGVVALGWGWARLRGRPGVPLRQVKLAEVAGKLTWWALRRDRR